MKKLENNTVLNSTIDFMHEHLGSVAEQSQLTSNILNQIQKSRRKIKPYRPRKLCQYPHKNRIDEFDMSHGLGKVNLQPCIDSLNNFKVNAINTIKTKFQAMGPETAKDTKLAAGAIELIKEVMEAAKCFSQMVQNVNKLIDSYIQAGNLIVGQVVITITTLTDQIEELKNKFISEAMINGLIGIISIDLLEQLQNKTDIFDMPALS